jgi:putative sugar O-methyltransferase
VQTIKYIKDFTRKIRSSLSFFFNKKEIYLKKKDLTIFNEVLSLSSKINYKEENKKKTHKIFSKNIINLIKNKKLLNFLQNGFVQQMFFVHNRLFILFQLIELLLDKNYKIWKNIIKEDTIGNPVRYFLYPISSGNKIHQAYHLKKFMEFSKIKLENFDNIVEFGGGYGVMAKMLLTVNKEIKYYIFDTPEVNLLQYYYLKRSGLEVGFKFNSNKKIILINDYLILKKIILNIDKRKKNLFIANWSFSEINNSFRAKLDFIKKKIDYQIIAYQEKFENINNKIYFEKLNKFNLRMGRYSKIIEMVHKKNNYYLFSWK